MQRCGHSAIVRIAGNVAALACCFLLAVSLHAQTLAVTLDPARTQIHFTLAAVLHTVRGAFELKSGTIRFDPATGTAGGEIVVDATSGDSGNHSRDRKMREKILETGKYPEIVFRPEQVQGHVALSGASRVGVLGVIQLHGTDHEVTLPAELEVTGDQITASVHFVIPYVEWGIRDPSTFLLRVGKDVDIDVLASGRLSVSSPNHR